MALAEAVVEDLLVHSPEEATVLGDHRYDDRLTDRDPAALAAYQRLLSTRLAEVRAVDPAELGPDNRVDRSVLANRLASSVFELSELRPQQHDPLAANPGWALNALLSRDFAPLPDRLRALTSRLGELPRALAVSRGQLREMPRVHLETAVGQFTGLTSLVVDQVDQALAEVPALAGEVDKAREGALAALAEHTDWLRAQLADPGRVDADPRLGAERYAAKLAFALETDFDPDRLLAQAEADLARAEEQIRQVAAGITGERPDTPGLVARVLAELAEDRPDDSSIVELCRTALEETTTFVRGADLVTVYEDPTEIIVMPEFVRGVAVAYCDPPGPLDARSLPTYVAVAPTPAGWPADRVDSFYREYNRHLVRNLMVHEGVPGHMLQLAHSRRAVTPTRVRHAFFSGSFVEGWAVYAERLMADRGYRDASLLMQQLKMRLRMIINTILDIRVHTRGMTEAEGMELMTRRGFQEVGEAVGKWRRALLTSAQLPTYYVGYLEVDQLLRDLAEARPGAGDRDLHDAVLAHGSPACRHLRTLLEL